MPRNHTGSGLLTARQQRLGVVRFDLDEDGSSPPQLFGFISGNAHVVEQAKSIGGVELHDLSAHAIRLELVKVYPQGVAEVIGHPRQLVEAGLAGIGLDDDEPSERPVLPWCAGC